ncbi:MBL fold metallo-hydrolase [Cyanobium sp. FGCU-52]|nr:MBL fold metallo-hydrolase [Cyanobium sp. FGCU52]
MDPPSTPPPTPQPPLEEGRPPQPIVPGLWLFAPNRDTAGGSSWLLEGDQGPVLVDVPALTQAHLTFLAQRPPGLIVLTGRDGHGRCRRLQEALGWPVLVQEQEAYLLPGMASLETFAEEQRPAPGLALLWTPGPGPGSCVLHARTASTDVLFCGRLLLPVGPGRLAPLHQRRTFHWPRLLRSIERLRGWLPAGSPHWIASGGGLGALRGEKLVGRGEALLAALDLAALASEEAPPSLG